MENQFFTWDERLGIHLPGPYEEWLGMEQAEQEEILFQWEKVRGTIPDRIRAFDKEMIHLQQTLQNEADFETSCVLNEQIASRASCVNDLWLWYRTVWKLDRKNA